MKPLFIKLAFLILGLKAIQAEDKIGFVYELVRHGARASLIRYEPYPFKVGIGYLTGQGMRQRFFQGVFNRDRYI
jgi:hypothetical protein